MKKLIFIIIFLFSRHLFAQVTQEWVATYSGVGIGANVPKKCLIDKQNNIIIAGRSENLSYNDDFIVLKYNSSGNLLWERRYNGLGNGNDAIADAELDDSDNIYVTGYSQEGTSSGGYNWITIKYLPNGDTAWKRRLNWTANSTDEPFAMVIDKLNKIFITGYGKQTTPYDDDLVTIKYDSKGNLEWTKVISSTNLGQDWGNSISSDDLGNIYINGYVSVYPGNRVTTIKYNNNGDFEWIRYFDTNYGDYLRPAHVVCDKDNNVIANGYYYLGGQYAFNTIKYNSSGDLLWNRIYKGDGNLNFCFALTTDDSSNVYAAGRSTNTGTGADFVTIKYYPNGDTVWIKIYDGGFSQADEIYSMQVDNSFNVYVTGRSDSTDGISDYLTIKYDLYGILKWKKKYNGYSLVDRSYNIRLDNNNNVIISGFSQRNANDFYSITIKYSQITNIKEDIISNFYVPKLISNYPNPFNSKTLICYEIFSNSDVELEIYNISGKEVRRYIYKQQFIGKYYVDFEENNLSSGIYFYSLIINGKTIDTKKMLLIK